MTPPHKRKIPAQSRAKTTVYPGSNLAAKDFGVHRSHLHRVLNGTRKSAALLRRWQEWMQQHPQFSALAKTTPAPKP